MIYRYLDCGVLRNGFARVRCGECSHKYLLAFSCKRRHFCPSCHQKRVVEFGEWVCGGGLKKGSPPPLCLQSSQHPSTLFPLRSFTPFRTESLCLGGLEGVFPGGGSARGRDAWSGHCHPDVWRFVEIQPSLPRKGPRNRDKKPKSVTNGPRFLPRT